MNNVQLPPITEKDIPQFDLEKSPDDDLPF
jgi:hypothetical protein